MFKTLGSTIAILALLAAASGATLAQATGHPDHMQEHMRGEMHGTMGMGQAASMADNQQMMKAQEKMQGEQQRMKTELDALVARMNASSGEARQQVMAELLTKLVEDWNVMNGMMSSMQSTMTGYMMQHMQSDDTAGMSGSPMMHSMRDADHGNEAMSGSGHSNQR